MKAYFGRILNIQTSCNSQNTCLQFLFVAYSSYNALAVCMQIKEPILKISKLQKEGKLLD